VADRLKRIDPDTLHTQFARLVAERGFLETLFQSIQEGVLVIAPDATLQFANAAAERLLGFRFNDARGRPVTPLLRDFEIDHLLAAPGDAADWPGAVTGEVEISAPEPRILSLYALPVENAPQHSLLVILRDVTREREQESSNLETERSKAVRLLAATVAHEIGNPLNALNIHLQLLRRELPNGDPAELDELLSVAQTEVARLDAIIAQFLLALRPAQPRFQPGDPARLLQESLLLLKTEFENRGITVSLDIPAGLPALQLDPVQIKQVYFNLLKNATEAMPDGGALKISFSVSDRWVAVAFLDSGHGIPGDELALLFQPFHTTKARGSGLGLMITQRIVHDHGGQIEVFSKPGAGACFRILLPLADRRVRRLK
jgi:signal transduction histidine kinase